MAYRDQVAGGGTAGSGRGSGEGSRSARAIRGGTASCTTSASAPAYRSATWRHSRSSGAVSTGSVDSTWASGASGPA